MKISLSKIKEEFAIETGYEVLSGVSIYDYDKKDNPLKIYIAIIPDGKLVKVNVGTYSQIPETKIQYHREDLYAESMEDELSAVKKVIDQFKKELKNENFYCTL